jgi:hypothetical protein
MEPLDFWVTNINDDVFRENKASARKSIEKTSYSLPWQTSHSKRQNPATRHREPEIGRDA